MVQSHYSRLYMLPSRGAIPHAPPGHAVKATNCPGRNHFGNVADEQDDIKFVGQYLLVLKEATAGDKLV